MVYKLVNDLRDRSSNIINPPPSTVSMVLARRFGVKASKSYKSGSVLGISVYLKQRHSNVKQDNIYFTISKI